VSEELIQRLLELQRKGATIQELLVEAYEAGYELGVERGEEKEFHRNNYTG
jgi:hypothetical protein